MSAETLKMIIDVIQTIITFGLGVWLYLDRRNDKTQSRISKLSDHVDERLDEHAVRLARVEADVEHMPTADNLLDLRREFNAELGAVHEKVNTVAQSNGRIEGVLGAMQRMVEDMNSYLRAH